MLLGLAMKNKVYACRACRCVAWKLSRRMRSVIAGFLLPGILCGVLGCGGSGTARVKGHVTLDGQPLQQGAITFVSVDGVARTVGTVVLDGQFIVDMPTGKKIVRIQGTKVVGQRRAYESDADSPMVDIVEDVVPAQYNSRTELEFDAKPGSNKTVFAITSR